MDGALLGIIGQLDIQSPEFKGYIAIGLGGIGLAYLYYRNNARKRRDPLASVGSPGLSLAQQRSVERQMQGLLVEMAEMSRQISAQLDTRAARLEALIEQSDQRLDELRRQVHARPSGAAPASAPLIDPVQQRVQALSDAGKSVHQIADELNLPRGEVELMLALRPSAMGDAPGRLAG